MSTTSFLFNYLQDGYLWWITDVVNNITRYEFKTNHEEWINTVKPRLGFEISARVRDALSSTYDNIKYLYKARGELRAALSSLLKVILFICFRDGNLLSENINHMHEAGILMCWILILIWLFACRNFWFSSLSWKKTCQLAEKINLTLTEYQCLCSCML